jgi:PiT family inorganic phosphate transporter
MDVSTFFIIFVITLAYFFDFINGFHDAANAVATIVTTGVLTPLQSVVWAAFFNFIAFLFFNLMVAKTIGSGLIDVTIVDAPFILAALVGAISWNLITWYYALPSSSSHALIGGLIGAAVVKSGLGALQYLGIIKVLVGILIAPVVGMAISWMISLCFRYFFRNKSATQLSGVFKTLQLVSSAFLSLTHGGNDAQKTMGIIAVLLFSAGWLGTEFYVPFWVVISCHCVISLGTLAGGWRIVHTMGTKITRINPMGGTAAEAGAAAIIFAATEYGVPVSTTHTVTGAIAGVGLAKGIRHVHWPILRRIFLSWLLTIPMTGLLSGLIMKVVFIL